MKLACIGSALLAAVFVLIPLGARHAHAGFILVTDFDGLIEGPIHQQDGWVAQHDTSIVTTDPVDTDNLVLAVTTDSTYLHREAIILNGTNRMMFFRFRLGSQQNFSVGMADSSSPSQFNHFDVEIGMSASTNELRINDDGMYDVLTELDSNTWYNCWLLINNEGDVTDVYLHTRDGEAAVTDDQLDSDGQTSFVFRKGAANDLIRYYIKTGGGSGPSGPLYLDDLYIENANSLNLSNPVAGAPCPADLSNDGVVNIDDVFAVLAAWGTCDDCPEDINDDGKVSIDDLFVILGEWGPCP